MPITTGSLPRSKHDRLNIICTLMGTVTIQFLDHLTEFTSSDPLTDKVFLYVTVCLGDEWQRFTC
jgi:hypothetical protein